MLTRGIFLTLFYKAFEHLWRSTGCSQHLLKEWWLESSAEQRNRERPGYHVLRLSWWPEWMDISTVSISLLSLLLMFLYLFVHFWHYMSHLTGVRTWPGGHCWSWESGLKGQLLGPGTVCEIRCDLSPEVFQGCFCSHSSNRYCSGCWCELPSLLPF